MALKVKNKSSVAACIYSLTTRQITLRSKNNILEGDLGIFCLFKGFLPSVTRSFLRERSLFIGMGMSKKMEGPKILATAKRRGSGVIYRYGGGS